uniref:Uncharacterized protein LOC100369968 n=1 Tax=Saccoglossus kowalevskii TaxID=10224 RepID=A0ABM0MGK5_SACKO|nr:PREDICTED: uncharacterized protein LOC100369968 [Saccoglossus kowalevskii]
MPAKKKGGKKGKGKGKKKKKIKGLLESPDELVKRLMKVYTTVCQDKLTAICPGIRKFLKECLDDNKLCVKFILEPIPDYDDSELSNVQLEPLIQALRNERYKYVKEIYVWDIVLQHTDVASLVSIKFGYKCILLFYRSCNLFSTLTVLCFDYNEFGDEGVYGIAKGLKNNRTLLSLSLCYCDLGITSGKLLGDTVATTALRELYLNGNNLESEGAVELIKLVTDNAKVEHYEREEAARLKSEEAAQVALDEKAKLMTLVNSGSDKISESGGEKEDETKSEKSGSAKSRKGGLTGKKKKKKGKKKKKKKEPPPPPAVGPWLHKLHLADNGIDAYSKGSTFAPVICMNLFKELIMHSDCLKELDLDDNLIGDLGGKEILEGLQQRKEFGLNSMKVSVTHRMMLPDTFSSIIKLGAGLKKKKKKKGKGKKKKK